LYVGNFRLEEALRAAAGAEQGTHA
jgi:hypothetical protein